MMHIANGDGQIRIIVDTHSHLHPKKKKKNHRGYAFVVFERERDMRGTFPRHPFRSNVRAGIALQL